MTTIDESEIRQLLDTYEQSLNTSDAHLAVSCYTPDGQFIPTTQPTSSGAQLEDAYLNIFKAIELHVAFTLDELVVASDDVAYALTRSNGTQTVHATGVATPESNRELFIFGRDQGAWKIARYMFNKPE